MTTRQRGVIHSPEELIVGEQYCVENTYHDESPLGGRPFTVVSLPFWAYNMVAREVQLHIAILLDDEISPSSPNNESCEAFAMPLTRMGLVSCGNNNVTIRHSKC